MKAKDKIRRNAHRDLRRFGLISTDLDEFFFDLTPVQQEVIDLRYGEDKTRSWDEVAWHLGVNRETARRTGKRALARIQTAFRAANSVRSKVALKPALRNWDGMVNGELWIDQTRVDQILPGLYQSGIPDEERLQKHGIGFVVDVSAFPRKWENPNRGYVEYPLSDTTTGLPPVGVMLDLAGKAVEQVGKGVPTLINCQMGWNRSGLIMGVTVWLLTGKSGAEVVDTIKSGRPHALGNELFRKFISSLPAFDELPSWQYAVETLEKHSRSAVDEFRALEAARINSLSDRYRVNSESSQWVPSTLKSGPLTGSAAVSAAATFLSKGVM